MGLVPSIRLMDNSHPDIELTTSGLNRCNIADRKCVGGPDGTRLGNCEGRRS